MQRLKDCSRQQIISNIRSSPKAVSYKLYKHTVIPETFLSLPLSYTFKKVLANFRCSGHNLMIERGRHLKIDRGLRYCQYCLSKNRYTLENEFHFLLVCENYNELRQTYFPHDWKNSDISEDLFISIMSDTSTRNIYALCRFLMAAFELHKLISV